MKCIRLLCRKAPHEGSKNCIEHCKISDHGHCIASNCNGIDHKNSNCEKHCEICPKIHCTKRNCRENIKFCEESKDFKCLKCCTVPTHDHCENGKCDFIGKSCEIHSIK